MKVSLSRLPTLFPLTLLAFSLAAVAADTNVWLIGGGNHIENSQGQIEQNVIWLQNRLRNRTSAVNTYYAAGHSDVKDVAFWAPREESPELLQPLARVFAPVADNGKQYKRHSLSNASGGTDKHSLVKSLVRDFNALPEGEDVLLIYNGHGGADEEDTTNNHLHLWGGEDMSVRELDRVLDEVPAGNTVRFVLTQCYSGAFHNLIYDTPQSRQLSRQRRCGFMAESAYRQAEGCDLGVNKEEFRDYTTYFFAALSGRTRLDTPLESNPDLNYDNRVSFREAHLYTLLNAHSNDLSRATSETYLEYWQPWPLRWDSAKRNEGSVYWRIARELAERNGWTLKAADLLAAQARLQQQIAVRTRELNEIYSDIERLQERIQGTLRARWPELFNPYTYEYHRVIDESLAEIQQAISRHPDYPMLVENQDNYLNMSQERLELERTFTQVEKVFRMKKLARLEAQFERYASDEHKAEREQLLACEEGFID